MALWCHNRYIFVLSDCFIPLILFFITKILFVCETLRSETDQHSVVIIVHVFYVRDFDEFLCSPIVTDTPLLQPAYTYFLCIRKLI